MHGITAARSVFLASNALTALTADMTTWLLDHPLHPLRDNKIVRLFNASSTILHRAVRDYSKQPYGIHTVCANGNDCNVMERKVSQEPFCNLVAFETLGTDHDKKPPVLLIAPLSGHYATLLSGTIKSLLRDRRVFVTDWVSAEQVPLYHGRFGLDEYMDYLRRAINTIGEKCHIVSVCQSGPASLATLGLMQEHGDPLMPLSFTPIAAPINPHINPTEVNKAATDNSIDWFRAMTMDYVPVWKPGALRLIRSGAEQVACFWNLKKDEHIEKGEKLFWDIADNKLDDAQKTDKFYREYLTTSDIPGEFYLETIENIFQKNLLAKGFFPYRGKNINVDKLKHVPVLVVEGERDNITGLGQTKAIFEICPNLRGTTKTYDVGHYGAFTGSTFDDKIAPAIFAHMKRSESPKTLHL